MWVAILRFVYHPNSSHFSGWSFFCSFRRVANFDFSFLFGRATPFLWTLSDSEHSLFGVCCICLNFKIWFQYLSPCVSFEMSETWLQFQISFSLIKSDVCGTFGKQTYKRFEAEKKIDRKKCAHSISTWSHLIWFSVKSCFYFLHHLLYPHNETTLVKDKQIPVLKWEFDISSSIWCDHVALSTHHTYWFFLPYLHII